MEILKVYLIDLVKKILNKNKTRNTRNINKNVLFSVQWKLQDIGLELINTLNLVHYLESWVKAEGESQSVQPETTLLIAFRMKNFLGISSVL